MLEPIDNLIATTALFEDSEELADALRGMADDDVISANGGQVYYLREAAHHIEALYEHMMGLTRALEVLHRQSAAGEWYLRGDDIERLRGVTPEVPPRPTEGNGLPRYGLRWNGPHEPVSVPMDDGYWTPWHLADLLRAQLVEAQKDEQRLDWIIEHRAYVVSAPDCCDGYWLNYARPDGTMWTQATEHETPRAAIDAAKGESNG